MAEKEKSSRFGGLVSLIMVISLAPLALAWWLNNNPEWLSGRINYGHLIEPVIAVGRSEFNGLDDFSRQHIDEIRGRWILVHIVTDRGCHQLCRESLHKTKQIRLMLNKDLMRVRRLAVTVSDGAGNADADWQKGHDYLLRVPSTARLLGIMRRAVGGEVPEGAVFLMDPIGNFMMWYEPGFDPYGMKKDLKRLLYASQVG